MRSSIAVTKLVLCLSLFAPALAQPRVVPPPADDPSTFSLITGRDPILTLAGKWRFHPGDDSRYADPAFDDSQWPLLKSDTDWFDQGYKGLSGYAWYRFRFVLPRGDEPMALELPAMATSYQIFLDGKLIHTVGSMGTGTIYTTQHVVIPLAPAARTSHVVVSVAIRIWHAPIWAGFQGGGPLYEGHLGSLTEIDQYEERHRYAVRLSGTVDIILGLISLFVGVASLVLFLFRRSAREYMWFALLCLAYLLQCVLDYGVALSTVSSQFLATVDGFLSVAFSLSLIFLLRQLFEQKPTWLYRVAIGATVLGIINGWIVDWLHVVSPGAYNEIGAVLEIIFNFCLIVIIVRKALQRDRDARLLLFPICIRACVELTVVILAIALTVGHPFQFSLAKFTLLTPFVVRPSAFADLILFVGLFAVLLNRFARTSREQDRIAAEFESARTLQQVLIPEALPAIAGSTIATAYHPAQEVGGDFFQIIPDDSGDTLIVLGDVSGKGLPAAMTVSLVVGAVRTLAEFTQSPAAILAGLNRRLHGRGGFTTCLALRLSASGSLTFANAGHLAPYLNGKELETDPALPLGLDPDASFAEQTCQLTSGDHLTLVTDGVVEAADPEGQLFGFDRTLAASSQSALQIAGLALAFGQNDDITVLTLDFA